MITVYITNEIKENCPLNTIEEKAYLEDYS